MERQTTTEVLQPTQLSAETAQHIYNEPWTVWEQLEALDAQLSEHYARTGMAEHRPKHADYLVTRAMWRACLAPLLHGIELEMAQRALPLMQDGRALAPATLRSMKEMDDLYAGKHAGQNLEFMRVATCWSMAATEKFLQSMDADERHWANPIWQAMCAVQPEFQKQGLVIGDDPYKGLQRMVADTNSTFLSTIVPFLKAQMPVDRKSALLQRSDELAWAASSKKTFLEALLGIETGKKNSRKTDCPFHAEPDAAHVWQVPSLQAGPWRVPGYCAANVPLLSPRPGDEHIIAELLELTSPGQGAMRAEQPQTVAHLRFIFAAHVAAEIL